MLIEIEVCTFRRASSDETLRSLDAIIVPRGTRIRLIVADNDILPSAAKKVAAFRSSSNLQIHYLHYPAGNISIARNACLDAASGDYLAFIDDDEEASANWLVELLAVARATEADAVLGPAHGVCEASAPEWMKEGDSHSTKPVVTRDGIRTGYTCNVLLRRSERVLRLKFKLALGCTGGEDTAFFATLKAIGGTIAYAPKALFTTLFLTAVQHWRGCFNDGFVSDRPMAV